MRLADRERDKYETVWSAIDRYGEMSPGERCVPRFLEMASVSDPARCTVLDAGCGSGKGALALERSGFTPEHIHLCDLTDRGLHEDARRYQFNPAVLWSPLRPQLRYLRGGSIDYVYCCDVLEHVSPTFTMLTIARLLEIARRGVFLSISTLPDGWGDWVGETLHLTVQSFTDWRDQIAEIGRIAECRDCLSTGQFWVTPR